jgi:hypothetical protein
LLLLLASCVVSFVFFFLWGRGTWGVDFFFCLRVGVVAVDWLFGADIESWKEEEWGAFPPLLTCLPSSSSLAHAFPPTHHTTNTTTPPLQKRYKLLLTELLKHTPEGHDDYADLCAAVQLVSGVVNSINEDIKRQEKRFKVRMRMRMRRLPPRCVCRNE